MWLVLVVGGTVVVPNCQCNSVESNDRPGNSDLIPGYMETHLGVHCGLGSAHVK